MATAKHPAEDGAARGRDQSVVGFGEGDVDVNIIAAMLDEHARLTASLRDKIAMLGDSDRDRWVGLGADGVLAIGHSLDEVVDHLKERGARDGTFVVEFLSAEPFEMIL